MKRIALMAFATLSSLTSYFVPLHAQYTDYKAQKASTNRPYTEIPALGGTEEVGAMLFNFDWCFQLGNPDGAEREDLDDSAWRRLDLPHDFQFEQPWDEQAGGARGFKAQCEGWYRKTFRAEESWKGLQVLLDFEGMMYYGDVYVNGKKVASSEYGYLGSQKVL